MTTAGRLSAIGNGATLAQFMIHHFQPFVIGIKTAHSSSGCRVVAEVILKRIRNHIGVRGRLIAIAHLDGRATILHQFGNGSTLCGSIATGVDVEHIAPVEGGLRQGSHRDAWGVAEIFIESRQATSHLGIIVILHDLSHSGSHTTRSGFLA